MSTIRKLNPKHRQAATDRHGMIRAMRMRFASAQGPEGDLYLAVHIALDKLRRDPARTGEAKLRIYKQILAEYMLNVARLRGAVTETAPPA